MGEAARKAGFMGPVPPGKIRSLVALRLLSQILLNPGSQYKAVRPSSSPALIS